MSIHTLRDCVLDVLHDLTQPHRYAHHCDGIWYGNGQPCPAAEVAGDAAAAVHALHSTVHTAAEDPATARAVAEGMTGLDLTPGVLPDDEREGWTETGRRAVETLAATLDAAHDRERRAWEARQRTRLPAPADHEVHGRWTTEETP